MRQWVLSRKQHFSYSEAGMHKDNRLGGKFSGNHSTMIHVAAIVADIAHECPFVYNISPSFITTGLKPINGQRRVKILDDGPSILLIARDNISVQEVRVYSKNRQATKLAIARGARDRGLHIAFRRKEKIVKG